MSPIKRETAQAMPEANGAKRGEIHRTAHGSSAAGQEGPEEFLMGGKDDWGTGMPAQTPAVIPFAT